MSIKLLSAIFVLGFVSGCADKISLSGKYDGTMPCADCEGIESSLYLDKSGVYSLNSTYVGRDDYTYQTSGVWFINQNEKVLELVDDQMQYYVVADDVLELLDKHGKRVDMGEHYQIKK